MPVPIRRSSPSADQPLSRRFAVGVTAACVLAFGLIALLRAFTDTASFYLYREDRWLLLAQAAILLVAGLRPKAIVRPIVASPWIVGLVAAGLIAFCYWGHWAILAGFNQSRDEQMAVFDAAIYARGLRAYPLPVQWQAHAAALNTLFMLPVSNPSAWVSAYLPVNAGLHALVGLAIDPVFTGPILTAVGAIALWRCARLLWPDSREPATLALILYATSGQVVMAGMTAYAMPGHLALNLVWLWLFLLDRRGADLGAVAIGFAATGLHQPLFHPLFILPFVVLLLRRRSWSRLAIYLVGYAAISLFWLAWPLGTHAAVAGPHSITDAMGTDYWSRLRLVIKTGANPRFLDMTGNLLRFMAWQNVLLIPLTAIGLRHAWRAGVPAALAAGLILPAMVMFVLLPDQGHGFGYRYLHGVIGSAILLAVLGWNSLSQERDVVRDLFVRATAGSLLILLPAQAIMSHAFYGAMATVDRRIAASGTDYFIIGDQDAPFTINLLSNRADLSNRPVRLIAQEVDPAFLRHLCQSRPRIGLPRTSFFTPINRYFFGGAPARTTADKRIARFVPSLRAAGCQVSTFG